MNKTNSTAIGLARYACEYYAAAMAADRELGDRPGYEIVAPPPVMFLVAHSIELVLKSHLIFKDTTEKELQKLGHSLGNCWSAVVTKDVAMLGVLDQTDLQVLELISKLHVSTELRYIRTGWKDFPAFGPLQTLADKLLDSICPIVGYDRPMGVWCSMGSERWSKSAS